VLRLVYNVLLVLFLAVLAVFVPGASQAKVLSDVMSTLTGPLFENVLASMEIRLAPPSSLLRHSLLQLTMPKRCCSG
jgi:hypothetical protein